MNIANETLTFLLSCGLGILFGVFYDFIRILRLVFPHFKTIIFIEDVFFFAILSITSFAFILEQTNGVLRGFVIFGEVLGAFFYFFTASMVIMKLLRNLFSKLRHMVVLTAKNVFTRLFPKKFCKNSK